MMKSFTALRRRMDEAALRRMTRRLDNHLLRDIGLPEHDQQRKIPTFYG